MLFNSLAFALFFPVVTTLYFLSPHRWRWLLLLIASSIFYMAFVPVSILILIFTILVDYAAGRLIESSQGRRRRGWLLASLVANVGVLAIFKYYGFIADNLLWLKSSFNVDLTLPPWNILLPLGLSFHTSRSLAFHGPDWLNWIGPARPFHFDATSESLLGVRGKLQLLERERIPVRHALIVLDDDLLRRTTDTADIVTIKHPAISGGSRVRFHAVFLKAFVSSLFPLKYLDYRLFKTYRAYMAHTINVGVFTRDDETNDSFFTESDKGIASQPEQYYAAGRWEGVDRSPRDAAPVIDLPQRQMLQDIRAALDRQFTKYEIVVSPDFGRVRLNPNDLAILQEIFGTDHVHDFSRDPSVGLDIRDWYETVHDRPTVGRKIMRRIYTR